LNTITRRQETKLIKDALRSAGFDVASVDHGKGAAWGWIHVRLSRPLEFACEEHGSFRAYDHKDCRACCEFAEHLVKKNAECTAFVLKVTGRRNNEYDGNISVSFQR
jgi:hypothetical protein